MFVYLFNIPKDYHSKKATVFLTPQTDSCARIYIYIYINAYGWLFLLMLKYFRVIKVLNGSSFPSKKIMFCGDLSLPHLHEIGTLRYSITHFVDLFSFIFLVPLLHPLWEKETMQSTCTWRWEIEHPTLSLCTMLSSHSLIHIRTCSLSLLISLRFLFLVLVRDGCIALSNILPVDDWPDALYDTITRVRMR